MHEPAPLAALRPSARGPRAREVASTREGGARPAPGGRAGGEAGASDEAGADRERGRFHCAACGAHVADRRDLFAAAGAAETAAFVNPAGRRFEVVTLLRARAVAPLGEPTSEASWYAGYAWQVAVCARCGEHLGWRYRATGGAEPPGFYGLIRASLVERGA